SGRTGRAGKSGISLTIIHSKEIALLKAMERRLGREIVYSKVPGGREICEKQLFHFIDTVERIEVDNAQIDSFLPNVYKKLSWLSREELIQRFVSVEFNRFLTYYKDTKEIDHSGESTPRKEKADVEFKTFRLGIGYVSQVTKRDLMRYINQLKVSRSIEIGQIDILSDHTLVDLDAEYEEQLLKAFSRNKYQGIPVAAEVVDAPRRKRSGSYESKPRDSKPRDYKPRDDKPREFKPRDNKAREFKPREYSGKKTYKKDK
ncbi:MAG: DEAD/DEAH box helicase, partial [Actinomycetota bacterium]|nr:DEAD/DEAH box helicase [Actinomycetota bacterium]